MAHGLLGGGGGAGAHAALRITAPLQWRRRLRCSCVLGLCKSTQGRGWRRRSMRTAQRCRFVACAAHLSCAFAPRSSSQSTISAATRSLPGSRTMMCHLQALRDAGGAGSREALRTGEQGCGGPLSCAGIGTVACKSSQACKDPRTHAPSPACSPSPRSHVVDEAQLLVVRLRHSRGGQRSAGGRAEVSVHWANVRRPGATAPHASLRLAGARLPLPAPPRAPT